MFDKAYYENLWGAEGVNRQDYCDSISEMLLSKYGKCKILDIGCASGQLVKMLREKGCDAWGIDVSEYAVANKCDSNIIIGDVRDIPFKDNYFDCVFSQGLWCHINEEDISKAWSECKRVGKHQEHNIDYEEAPTDIPYFVTRKSKEWWDEKLKSKILVACPTHRLKEYSFQEWIDCVNNLDYPDYDVLVVDNSPDEDFYLRWKDKVNMVHLPNTDQSENASARINASMEVIKKHFLKGNYEWWFNLESDVIIPPHGLNLLLKYPSDWTSHGYPCRGGSGMMQGIGCSLLSKSIAEAGVFTSSVHGADHELWEQTMKTHKTISLTLMMDIKHLGKENGYGG